MFRAAVIVGCLALCLTASSPLSAQAVVSEITPDEGAAVVERLGASAAEALSVGLELAPGDLVSSDQAETVVALECPPGSNNSYNLTAPFRILISVPEETTCHVNMLSGAVDVLAEEPTTVTVGGVEMKSVGTQYAVRVWREAEEPERKLLVYDGEVKAEEAGEVKTVTHGRALAFRATLAQAESRQIDSAEIDRSAEVYSRVDLAKAIRVQGDVGDRQEVKRKLKAAHYEVLEKPDDTPKRVELARVQMDYQLNDKAVYQLKRANAVDEESFERYQIDPKVLETGVSQRNLTYLQEKRIVTPSASTPNVLHVTPDLVMTLPPVAERTPAVDLRLIEVGRAREALAGPEHRFSQGTGDSRDAYVMAKAYAALEDTNKAAGWAGRAIRLHSEDGKLSDSALREMERLHRAGGSG